MASKTVAVAAIEISISFSDGSNAAGALLHYICNSTNGELMSGILILDRNMSQNYTLPFNSCFGKYQISFYDIEKNGLLYSPNGVSYPAAELNVIGNGQGKSLRSY